MGDMAIKLGDEVKDSYTGFKGIAVARTDWLYGCARIGIKPSKLDKDGKTFDIDWFDEPQVELVKSRKPKQAKAAPKTSKPGGPQRDPRRRRDP